MLVFKNEPYVSIRELEKIFPELFWLDYQILFWTFWSMKDISTMEFIKWSNKKYPINNIGVIFLVVLYFISLKLQTEKKNKMKKGKLINAYL